MINVNLIYEDNTIENRCFPKELIPKIGDAIKIDNIGYLIRNVMYDINSDPNAATQIKCIHIFLKGL